MPRQLPDRFVEFSHPRQARLWEQEHYKLPSHKAVAEELEQLINSAKREQDVHSFFETYPHLLPGIDTYHNGPMSDVVISKLPLGNDFVTDFAFVSENSQEGQMTFIEIESPTKRIFNRGGEFSRDYLDAKQQLVDWNFWAQNHLKDAAALFGPMGRYVSPRYHDPLTLQTILVIGRRSQIKTRKERERWSAEAALLPKSMRIMTYDRVIEHAKDGWHWPFRNPVLVCSYGDRRLSVKRVAPLENKDSDEW